MTQTTEFRVTAADHFGYSVASLAASIRFWTEALGATLVRTGTMGGTFLAEVTGARDSRVKMAIVEVGGIEVELLEYDSGRVRPDRRIAPVDAGAAHLALRVSDLDEAIARCRAHGWHAQGIPQVIAAGPKAGSQVMYVVGPDGETIEFLQPLG